MIIMFLKKCDLNKSNDLMYNIRNSNFNLRDMKNDFCTINNNTYKPSPNVVRSCINLEKDLLKDLKGTC